MNNYAVHTWSLFFGLIVASIYTLFKSTKNIMGINLVWLVVGASLMGCLSRSRDDTGKYCIYILLWIYFNYGDDFTRTFRVILLLILGKYQFITGAIKNPFDSGNILIMGVFATGAALGLTLFSRFLKYLLHRFHDQTMIFLVGVLIGSLKGMAWKTVLDSLVIRGKQICPRRILFHRALIRK